MHTSTYYRPDIDGLRAVAVLSVLLFHLSASLLPGGFVGVDVFFVISGYLISTILFSDLAKGKFSIATFYARRIKRIFPALITVLLATCVVGWVLMFPDEFENLGKHIVGGVGFVANLLLWKETGYFADAAEAKPLLHLWSLGIEEQFYLFFPLILWGLSRMGLQTTRYLVALLCASLALSYSLTPNHPDAAFYLPMTRFWELLVGCVMASIEHDRKLRSGKPTPEHLTGTPLALRRRTLLSNLAAVVGVTMIMGSAAFLTKAHPFPGTWALLPSLGAALLIYGGKSSAVNRWLLGNKVLVGVGLISYPLYLWHWPALYFARALSYDPLSPLALVGVGALSIVLAALTYWLIERPIRFGASAGPQMIRTLCLLMAGVFILGICLQTHQLPSRLGLDPLSAELADAKRDWDYPFKAGFALERAGANLPGAPKSTSAKAVLFVGDSHMQHYWPRLESALTNAPEKARPIFFATATGTPTLPNVNRVRPGYACDRFFRFAMRQAARTNIGTVVFTCFWEKYFIGSFPGGQPADLYRVGDKSRTPLRIGTPAASQVFTEFGEAIAELKGMGKEVVVLLSTPASTLLDPRATSRIAFRAAVTNQVQIRREAFETFLHPIKQELADIVRKNGGQVIDPLDYFEEAGYFNAKAADGRFRYKDASHLRPFYVTERATFLDSLIRTTGDRRGELSQVDARAPE